MALSTKRWNGYRKRRRLTKKLIPWETVSVKSPCGPKTYRMDIQWHRNNGTVADQTLIIDVRRLGTG